MGRLQNNPVLATAAYNAGPNKIAQWLPDRDSMAADIWAETIPYQETRSYVQRVMEYAAIYTQEIRCARLDSSARFAYETGAADGTQERRLIRPHRLSERDSRLCSRKFFCDPIPDSVYGARIKLFISISCKISDSSGGSSTDRYHRKI